MNTKYMMKKQRYWLLCLIGMVCFSSCNNENEEQNFGDNLSMNLMAQVNKVKSRARYFLDS